MNTKGRRQKAEIIIAREQKPAFEQLRAADRRVGLRAEARARWLVDFARRRLEYATRQLEGQSLSARWDALAFAYGGRWEVGSEAEPPTWAEVTKAYNRLRGLIFSPFRHKQPAPGKWTGDLWLQADGRVTATTRTSGLTFVDAFMVQVCEALRGLANTRLRLRFCPVCPRPFLSKRKDAEVCPTGSCRTLAWRKRHQKEFRAARREAYRRRMVEKTGNPNVRIQTRKKEG